MARVEVHKHIRLTSEQEVFLKQKAAETGVSEAALLRGLLDRSQESQEAEKNGGDLDG